MTKGTNYNTIIKNTLILYVKMFFSIGVSLYTSRVVLQSLGIVDFGVYGVVGGVVAVLNFLRVPLAFGTQRFLNFELGRGNHVELQRIFSMSLNIHLLIALALVILAETVGLWFLNTHMDIPPDRLAAANWVFQFSVLSAIFTLIQVPYTASVSAHEKMKAYTLIGIAEVVLRLIIVLFLAQSAVDRLKLYAVLICTLSGIITIVYRQYCIWSFHECSYVRVKDARLFKKLIGFVGWNITSSVSLILNNQGQNILLNLFFGPVVNAAVGIAYQINNAIFGVMSYFQMATKPQIIQSYAKGKEHLPDYYALTMRSSRFSFFLLLLFIAPLLVELPFVLGVWLTSVPEYTEMFCRLILLSLLMRGISQTLDTAALATGDIKNYQIRIGCIDLLNLPTGYLLLRANFPPTAVFVVSLVLNTAILFTRLGLLKKMVKFPVGIFIRHDLSRALAVFSITMAVSLLIKSRYPDGVVGFLIVVCATIAVAALSILYIGVTRHERAYLFSLLTSKRIKQNKK